MFVTLQYNEDEPKGDTIEKLSFSIDENNLKPQGSLTEKAALLKLWNFDTDNGEPLVFQEFHIGRPVLHYKFISNSNTIEEIRQEESKMMHR